MSGLTADHVARALVAACRETDEDPLVVASGEPGAWRSRHYAMWALLHVFGKELGTTAAARLVACTGKPAVYYYNSKKNVIPGEGRGVAWWNPAIYQRVIEAIGSNDPPARPAPPPYKPGPLPAAKVAPEAKLGRLEPDGYRQPTGTARAVLEDDDDTPIFDRGRIGGKKPRDHRVLNKRELYEELRTAVENTAKMMRPTEK